MVNRTAAVTAVALLLAVAQVTSALVVPEVVVMRVKRNPEPMRSFSFSGFNPNGQLAAFTGMTGMEPYPSMFGGNYGPPSQAGTIRYDGQPQTPTDTYGPPDTQYADSYGPPDSKFNSYGPPASGTEQQAADSSKKQQQYGGVNQQEYGQRPGADSKEQNNNSAERVDDKKQYKGRDGPSSNAEASFNAWFPIMFGVFPNGAGGHSGNSAGRGNNYQGQGQGQGQDQGNSYGGNNGFERSSGGTTVIANSVSNGRHGSATSHAIAYGNPRSTSK